MSNTIRDTLAIIEAYKAGSAFDPHALAMALQLADLLEADAFVDPSWRDGNLLCHTAKWLRAEVQRELESQP